MDERDGSLDRRGVSAGAPAGAPVTPVVAPPVISPVGALLGVFTKPSATFAALAPKPRFLLALLVVLAVQLAAGYAVFQSGAVLNDSIAKLEAKGESPEAIAMTEKALTGQLGMILVVLGGGFAVAFIMLLHAALMFFMGNLMLGARLQFPHYLCVAAYSSVVGIPDMVVRTILAVGKESMDVRLGVGAFLGEELGPLGRALDTMTDPLLIWSTLVAAIGASVFAAKGLRFGILVVLPGFLIGVLLSATR